MYLLYFGFNIFGALVTFYACSIAIAFLNLGWMIQKGKQKSDYNLDVLIASSGNLSFSEKVHTAFSTSIAVTLLLFIFAGFFTAINYLALLFSPFSNERIKQWTTRSAYLNCLAGLAAFSWFVCYLFDVI